MKANKQSYRAAKRAQVAERRASVANLYRKGWTQARIGRELGISQQMVSDDIRCLISQWEREAQIDIAACIAIELEKMNALEAYSWAALEQSGQPQKIVGAKEKSSPPATKSSYKRTVERHEGDPRYLMLILHCIASRIKLLRLDKVSLPESGDQKNVTFEQLMATYREKQRNGNGAKSKRPPFPKFDPQRLP